jgi:predicted alpha/beta-fold hydrolase
MKKKHIEKDAPFIAVGFSMGANILTKYLGEEGPACPLTAAVSIANPYDFVATNGHITHCWFRKRVYNATITKNLLHKFFHEV